MKERPILFSTPMVRALLEGRKTQTRRIVKSTTKVHDCLNSVGSWDGPEDEDKWLIAQCPHGKPGDRLWVREKWAARGKHTDSCSIAEISANRSHFEIWYADSCIRNGREQFNTDFLGKWRPSIFMPRNLSRILLEVTDVRVERLQEISEGDAIAEGWEPLADENPGNGGPFDWYRSVWKSINGPGSWDANPWVWVISFKRIEPK